MRVLIRWLDALLRRRYGVFEFCDNPDCLLRLQRAKAPRDLRFPDRLVQAGEPVLLLHLWNEHLLTVPPEGPDLGWAKTMQRAFVQSLQAAARYIQSEPAMADIRAIGAESILVLAGEHGMGVKMMQRLGFTVMPYETSLGRFGEFWENFYSWLLIWNFNPNSLPHRNIFRIRRAGIWVLPGDFIERYGSKESRDNP